MASCVRWGLIVLKTEGMGMKRFVAAATLAVLASSSMAQGYAGAVLALTRLNFDCKDSWSCDKASAGLKLYGGTKFKKGLDFGVGVIDALEVGYMKAGKGKSSGSKVVQYINDDNDIAAKSVSASESALADAMFVSAVAHLPIMDDMKLSARVGVAYVSATLRNVQEGTPRGGVTTSKVKPYAGLGLEYEIPNLMKVVGGFDWTQFEVQDRKGSVKLFGVGVETAF